jgi:hypothetical protein
MKAERMREELRTFDDSSCDGVPLVEEMVMDQGHMCVFIPCELNPIERCWCHVKKFTRAHCNGSIISGHILLPVCIGHHYTSEIMLLTFHRLNLVAVQHLQALLTFTLIRLISHRTKYSRGSTLADVRYQEYSGSGSSDQDSIFYDDSIPSPR